MYKVKPTDNKDRKQAGSDYIIVVNKYVKDKCALNNYGVVQNEININDQNFKIRAWGKIIIDNTKGDDAIGNDTIKLDQTLRTAIGLPTHMIKEKQNIDLFPLKIKRKHLIREWFIRKFFGIRWLYFRVQKANIIDMEKDFARLTENSIQLLGTKSSKKILIINVNSNNSGNGYTLNFEKIIIYPTDKDFILERKRKEKDSETKFFFEKKETLMKLTTDLEPIFLDEFNRKKLNISLSKFKFFDKLVPDTLIPVKARRTIPSLMSEELRKTGTVFLLGLISLFQIFPPSRNGQITMSTFIIIPIIIILTFLMMIWNIRKLIK